ncbi:TonB-linked outer membrane protein, SusC/RagA family [Fodinibius roseus]|uniref:TonB-linked outer membrane protein, SusC/RagA family n=1 Tax=Fodinibius roseus TaxID=1194090 RepID=A0A1M4ZNY1_9BACT|nr:TonB-dependent receptor [Fodinibius roseus]SHF19286.1 TonB-linked outer membrane protein, SusC/RagA family [Fodinibius roseus]
MFRTSVKRTFSYLFKAILLLVVLLALPSLAYALGLSTSSIFSSAFQQQVQSAESADTITVEGTVSSDSAGKPLPGVSVLLKGTKRGTTTDKQGHYSLEVSAEREQILSFSFVGYETREVPVQGREKIDVTLKKEVTEMEDVVVVGYGNQRRQDLTGSVSSISAADIQNESVTSPDQLLQGRVAGVRVTRNSGAPGGGSTVRIRGVSSLRAGNDPLYVIDGLPVGGGSSPDQNPLSLINPQDIVSIEVLKDASATAIYGSRGANGVVLITTEQGGGNTRVDFEAKYGISNVRKKLDLLNSNEFITLANEAVVNNNNEDNNPGNDEPLIFDPGGSYPDTDWQEEVFRSAPQQSYQLSLTGGGEGTQYAISANFLNEEGTLIGSGYRRGSFRINFNKQVSNRFTIGNNLIVSRANYDLIESGGRGLSGIVNGAIQIPATVPVKDENGNYVFQTENRNSVQRDNPVASALEKTRTSNRFRGLGTIYAEYMLAEGLEARVSLGGNLGYRKQNFYAPITTLQGQQNESVARVSTRQDFRWTNENTLTYENEFSGLHALKLLTGFTLEKGTNESLRGASSGFVTDAFEYNNLNAGESPNNPASGASTSTLASYLGRVNYGYDDRYLITLTGRVDGSSRFGAGNKYGFFPSAALAWRISNEPFMQEQNLFSNVKLRLSYGITGNQEIGNYAAIAQLANSQVTFGDRIAVSIHPGSLANEDLSWEKTTQYNVGLDMGLVNSRINLTADAYYKKTTDLLLIQRVPRYTGYSQFLDNIGSTENRGIEVSLNTQNVTGNSFSWNTSVNFALNRNNVVRLSDGQPLIVGTPISYATGNNFRIIREGGSIGEFYGYVYGGVYADQEAIDNVPAAPESAQPGDPYLKDISGPEGEPDGQIDGNDRTVLGNAFPDYTIGFTNNFAFKGFDFTVFLQGSIGNDVLNMNTLRLETARGFMNQTTDVLNRWTPDNQNTDIPRADRTRNGAAQNAMRAISSRLIEDGSYLRLKNVTVGYTLPVDWVSTFGARSLRIYGSALNLFTITNYEGYDPEVNTYSNLGNMGTDYGTYPKSRTYLMGIKLGF